MNIFDKNFYKYVESLYGQKRDQKLDDFLLEENMNTLPHMYSINENDRIDMTEIETYSVDPDGCQDADDAFSVFYQENKLFLAIHIADPTELITLNSELWKNIEERTITYYPSNCNPIHMMPEDIMEQSSLMDNKYGNIKNAVTILAEINPTTHLPDNHVKLIFTKIKVKKENGLSYETSSKMAEDNYSIKFALKIAESLQENRKIRTIGTRLKNVNKSILNYDNSGPYLRVVQENEKRMMHMIEEFAIFANTFVGNYLTIHFGGTGIFRSCDASSITGKESNLSGDELLHFIVTNGIRADYVSSVASHDLVGSEQYTHFTSPIRRASDCVCHYILKYLFIKKRFPDLEAPFSEEKLKIISNKCLTKTKSSKKIQYTDTKFRIIQVMNRMIHSSPDKHIEIDYYITGYISGFINIIITRVDNFPVYLSYSLKRNRFNELIDNKKTFSLKVERVNCKEKFDEGSIPELDNLFCNYYI
jgi:exoribonuclease R